MPYQPDAPAKAISLFLPTSEKPRVIPLTRTFHPDYARFGTKLTFDVHDVELNRTLLHEWSRYLQGVLKDRLMASRAIVWIRHAGTRLIVCTQEAADALRSVGGGVKDHDAADG